MNDKKILDWDSLVEMYEDAEAVFMINHYYHRYIDEDIIRLNEAVMRMNVREMLAAIDLMKSSFEYIDNKRGELDKLIIQAILLSSAGLTHTGVFKVRSHLCRFYTIVRTYVRDENHLSKYYPLKREDEIKVLKQYVTYILPGLRELKLTIQKLLSLKGNFDLIDKIEKEAKEKY